MIGLGFVVKGGGENVFVLINKLDSRWKCVVECGECGFGFGRFFWSLSLKI